MLAPVLLAQTGDGCGKAVERIGSNRELAQVGQRRDRLVIGILLLRGDEALDVAPSLFLPHGEVGQMLLARRGLLSLFALALTRGAFASGRLARFAPRVGNRPLSG